jgi:hypothetical protein
MKRFFVTFVLLAVTCITRDACALNAKLLKTMAGSFDIILSSYCPVERSNCLSYQAPTSGGVYKQLLTFSSKGAISGRWLKVDSLADLFNPIETDVYFTGKITKISSKGKKTTAKFSATGSDGSKITGTIVATKSIATYTFYDFKASFSVAVPGGTYKNSLIGIRVTT